MLRRNFSIYLDQNTKNVSSLSHIINFELHENKPTLKLIPQFAQHILCACLVISLTIGTYFKCVLYKHILRHRHDDGNSFKDRPINVMTLYGAIIHHITHLFMGVNYSLALGFDIKMGEIFGEIYCHIMLFVGVFGIAHLIVGSLAIAIFRVLYMKHGPWLKYRIGEGVPFCLLMFGGLLLTTILTVLYVVEESSHRVVINICMGQSSAMIDIMRQYEGPGDMPSGNNLQVIASCTAIFLVVAELGCYVVYFHHVFRNDNGNIRNFLQENVIRARNKKNTISFLGQFYGFVTEFIFMVILTITLLMGKYYLELKAISVVVKFIEFGAFAMVEVLTCQEIRKEYVDSFAPFFASLEFLWYWFF